MEMSPNEEINKRAEGMSREDIGETIGKNGRARYGYLRTWASKNAINL